MLLYATEEQRISILKPYPSVNEVAQRLDEMAAHMGKFQTSTEISAVREKEEELETDTNHRRMRKNKQPPVMCYRCGKVRHITHECRAPANHRARDRQ